MLAQKSAFVTRSHNKDHRHQSQLRPMLLLLLCCLLSSDVGCHIRDKLRPVPKHGSVLLYVPGNHKAR